MHAQKPTQAIYQFESFFAVNQAHPAPGKIVIDTDMGWDDSLSILYLLKKPEIDIAGITVTGCGETNLRWGTAIALALLELAGRTGIPVCAGTETPLKYDHVFPEAFRNDMNTLMGLLDGLPAGLTPDPRPAWQFLSETLNRADEPVTILSLGGFTNLGRMLLEYPDTKLEMIRELYAMAGALFVDGNVALLNDADKAWDQGPVYASNDLAEWNVFVDPVAAKMVFDSPIPLTLIPLDAANYVLLSTATVESLKPKDALGRLARRILEQKTGPFNECIPVPIFDPLAAMIMTGDLDAYQYVTGYFDVDVSNDAQNNTSGNVFPVAQGSRKIKAVQGVSSKQFAAVFAAVLNS